MKISYKRQQALSSKINQILSNPKRSTDNPVIKASQSWLILSKQLKDILDENVYNKWFKKVVPLVLTNHILILQAPSKLSATWINSHYRDLVDTLISFQDKKASAFFIPPDKNDI